MINYLNREIIQYANNVLNKKEIIIKLNIDYGLIEKQIS